MRWGSEDNQLLGAVVYCAVAALKVSKGLRHAPAAPFVSSGLPNSYCARPFQHYPFWLRVGTVATESTAVRCAGWLT